MGVSFGLEELKRNVFVFFVGRGCDVFGGFWWNFDGYLKNFGGFCFVFFLYFVFFLMFCFGELIGLNSRFNSLTNMIDFEEFGFLASFLMGFWLFTRALDRFWEQPETILTVSSAGGGIRATRRQEIAEGRQKSNLRLEAALVVLGVERN